MPSFSKKALSLYLRVRCPRQFRLYLYSDKEREALGMPPRDEVRGGLGEAGKAGVEWQNEKVAELERIFGSARVVANPPGKDGKIPKVRLIDVLPAVAPHTFVVEGEYEVTLSFQSAFGVASLRDNRNQPLDFANARPDIVQTLPPGTFSEGVRPDGEVEPLAPDDPRIQLRVIDVKLVSEPGAHYFAEVVYYSMTLAAWLQDQGLHDRFVTVSAAAVWPGSHGASKLAEQTARWDKIGHVPTVQEKVAAMGEDLEVAEFAVFAPRLRRLLRDELPALLAPPWDVLEWHVDFRCGGCEFLGYPWSPAALTPREELRCWPTAERTKSVRSKLTKPHFALLLHGLGQLENRF